MVNLKVKKGRIACKQRQGAGLDVNVWGKNLVRMTWSGHVPESRTGDMIESRKNEEEEDGKWLGQCTSASSPALRAQAMLVRTRPGR